MCIQVSREGCWERRVRHAAELRETYCSLPGDGDRREFLVVLANEVRNEATSASLLSSLYRHISSLKGGIEFLVRLRGDLRLFRGQVQALDELERELRPLIECWFTPSLLEVNPVFSSSPAGLLAKLSDSDAVHPMYGDVSELRNRLQKGRLFACFHKAIPDVPLVFLEVALVADEKADTIQKLLGPRSLTDMHLPRTAVFYSVTNLIPGLLGMKLGEVTIKTSLDLLLSEFPSLRAFVTLSPIAFGAYLDEKLGEADAQSLDFLTPLERERLHSLIVAKTDSEAIKRLLLRQGWHEHPEVSDALRSPLLRLARRLWLVEKRNGGKFVRDQTEHFHLSNGAELLLIYWLADKSHRALSADFGIMVSYNYRIGHTEANAEAYLGDGKIRISGTAAGVLGRNNPFERGIWWTRRDEAARSKPAGPEHALRKTARNGY